MAHEVSSKAHSNTDVNEIIDSIIACEEEVSASPNKTNIQTLLDLYQKAIEYYSAVQNDETLYTQYLNKMTDMFKDEIIQKVLSAPDEPTESKD